MKGGNTLFLILLLAISFVSSKNLLKSVCNSQIGSPCSRTYPCCLPLQCAQQNHHESATFCARILYFNGIKRYFFK